MQAGVLLQPVASEGAGPKREPIVFLLLFWGPRSRAAGRVSLLLLCPQASLPATRGRCGAVHQPEPCLRFGVTRRSRTPLPLSLSGQPPSPNLAPQVGQAWVEGSWFLHLLLSLSHEGCRSRVSPSCHPLPSRVLVTPCPVEHVPSLGVTAWRRWLCGCSSPGCHRVFCGTAPPRGTLLREPGRRRAEPSALKTGVWPSFQDGTSLGSSGPRGAS